RELVGNAQPHGRIVAELGGRLEQVELGAVVVRLRSHPFTAPCVRPLTIHFCSDMNSTAAGTAASTVPAANAPQRWPHCWSIKPFIPTGSVKWLVVCISALAITNSFSV